MSEATVLNPSEMGFGLSGAVLVSPQAPLIPASPAVRIFWARVMAASEPPGPRAKRTNALESPVSRLVKMSAWCAAACREGEGAKAPVPKSGLK